MKAAVVSAPPQQGPWIPPNAKNLTGHCRVALEEEHGGRDPKPFHKNCHGAYLVPVPSPAPGQPHNGWEQGQRTTRRCACTCHKGDEIPLDTDGEIKAARLLRELSRPGRPGDVKPGGNRLLAPEAEGTRSERPEVERRDTCAHGHPMTEENTGPRGVCRHCKRDASTRAKAKKSGRTVK
jgi:hypothetical protein